MIPAVVLEDRGAYAQVRTDLVELLPDGDIRKGVMQYNSRAGEFAGLAIAWLGV